MNFHFDLNNVIQASEMMLQGMIGIFVVLGIIALIVLDMGKMGGGKKKK